jgi:hypothetical protein
MDQQLEISALHLLHSNAGGIAQHEAHLLCSTRAEMLAIFLILPKDHSLKGYMKAYNRTLFFIFLFFIWLYTVRQRVLNDF